MLQLAFDCLCSFKFEHNASVELTQVGKDVKARYEHLEVLNCLCMVSQYHCEREACLVYWLNFRARCLILT